MSLTLDRRRFLGATGASLALLGLSAGRGTAAGTIRIDQQSWVPPQDIVPRKVAATFTAAHPNVEIVVSPGSSTVAINNIIAAHQAGVEPPYHVGFFNMENTERGLREGVWAPLDPGIVTNLDLIEDASRRPGDFGAFPWIDLGGIIYNKEKVPEPPRSWNDLFDPKYRGRVAMFDGFWTGNGLLATALVNGGSENDIEPALQIYEEAARSGHFHSVFTSNAQIQQLLASGEVWVAPHFRGIVLPWIKDGAPFGYAAPEEGQILFPEGLQLIAGGSEEQLLIGQQLINLNLSRENVIDYALTAAVVPVFKDRWLPDELAEEPALAPEVLDKAIRPDYARIAANHTAWLDQWNRRVKANLA